MHLIYFQEDWEMSEKTHPTVSRIVRTAVFAAGIAIAVYATDLIVKQQP